MEVGCALVLAAAGFDQPLSLQLVDQANGRGMGQVERMGELGVRNSLPKPHDVERRRRGIRLVGVAFDRGPHPFGDLACEGGEHVGGSQSSHSD